MSEFSFEAKGAVHEGGTKYYQVIRLVRDGYGSVVITHWGKHHPGAPAEPRLHGSTKLDLLRGHGAAEYNGYIKNKEKRGYHDWRVTAEFKRMDSTAFLDITARWLSVADRAEVLKKFFPKGDVSDLPIDESFDEAWGAGEPAESEFAPASSDHESWGSW